MKVKKPPYIRAGIVSLDILPDLIDERPAGRYKKMLGVIVKMSSQRYVVFQNSLKCCKCGLVGVYFAAEKTRGSRQDSTYHLNLYAVNEHGKEVLMTKDHILPRSLGGKDEHSNYQTMCVRCNNKKGNKLPADHFDKL